MNTIRANGQKRTERVTEDLLRANGRYMNYRTYDGFLVFSYHRHEYYVARNGDVYTATNYHTLQAARVNSNSSLRKRLLFRLFKNN